MSLRVYLINPRGFCVGVERAIQVAKQSAMLYKKLYVVEDVVHNNRVMQQLQEVGINKVDSIEQVPNESAFMISAHGMSPNVLSKLDHSITVVDGTCPIVKSVQKMIQRDYANNKKIILIGKRDHAEIIGYMGYANHENIYVVSSEMDIELLPDMAGDSVTCYSQTTLKKSVVTNLFNILRQQIPNIETKDESNLNICCATQSRQNAVIDVINANKVDMIIVAGSRSSSNTNELVNVAIDCGVSNSILVDDVSELSTELFTGIENVAITAGASCPEIVVQEIVEFIKTDVDPNLQIDEIGNKDNTLDV